MYKKIICILVSALMVMALIPAAAFAGAETRAATETKDQTQVVIWDFETDPLEDGWQFIDADGDGSNWGRSTLITPHSGTYSIASASYDGGARSPDNWAISPLTEIPEGEITLAYAIKTYSSSYPETYRIYVGTTDDINEMQPVTEDLYSPSDENWHEQSIDVSDYAGRSVYIAFRHYNCTDQWRFFIDDIEILAGESGGGDDPAPIEGGLIAGYYFESEDELEGWSWVGVFDTEWVLSGNNPGGYDYTPYAHEGTGFILSYSFVDYVGAYQADNWAITPAVALPDGSARLSFYATNANAAYPEAFDVYIGTSDETAEMTLLQGNISPNTGSGDPWTHYEIDISDYAGQTVYVGFYDHCYDMYEIWLDQVEFFGEGGQTPVYPTEPIAINEIRINGYESPVAGEQSTDYLNFTVPADANYEISYDDFGAPCWWDTDADILFMSTFVEGTRYSAGMSIIANEGYYFAEDCAVIINDSEVEPDPEYTGIDLVDNTMFYVWTMPEAAAAGEPEPSGILGDVDLDGDVDTADALMALRYVLGLIELNEDQLAQANVDGDGEVTVVDPLLILRKALDLIESFPAEEE